MRRLILRTLSGIVIVAVSFAGTLWLLEFYDRSHDPQEDAVAQAVADQIRVATATYGQNCARATVLPGMTNKAKIGNVTETVRAACDNRRGVCLYPIDAAKLTDPAPGCSKDFQAEWRCGLNPNLNRTYVRPEAHGKDLLLNCPR